MALHLSLIIPVYNEEQNLERLAQEINAALSSASFAWEAVFIDDGSRDSSLELLKTIAQKNPHFKVIGFKRNFGQTAALSAGFDYARGDIFIPLDADLQNDPRDVHVLLEKIHEGYDVVSGWRANRKDALISRKIPSWIANYIISRLTKTQLHDYGCTLKAYKREVLEGVKLYGEMHRFIPAYAAWHNAKITEVIVNHRPRVAGTTKYGISRTLRVLLDLMTVRFLTSYLTKPIHFFGKFGFFALVAAGISGAVAVYLRIVYHISFILTPLPLLTALLILVGMQFVLMGLLAEIIIRHYFESQSRPTYMIKEKYNFNE